MSSRKHFSCLILVLLLVAFSVASLHAQAPFYQGKTITMVLSADAGGTADLRVRAMAPFLQKYIPGNPAVVTEYMAGGGGRKAANYMFSTARPDGLTIGSMGSRLLGAAILGETGVLYDLDKFIYLGSPDSMTQHVFVTRQELGLTSLEKLRAGRGIRIGAQAVGHNIYIVGRLFAYFLDLKEPRFVVGYSGPEVDLALQRGEIDARGNLAFAVMQRTPEWIEKKLMNFHAILETPKGNKHPLFTHLPELESFARSDKERKILGLQRAFRLGGSALVIPPSTPADRVQILQDAVRRTLKEPAYRELYRKIVGEESSPLMPEELHAVIKEIPREPEVIKLFQAISGPDPLPER